MATARQTEAASLKFYEKVALNAYQHNTYVWSLGKQAFPDRKKSFNNPRFFQIIFADHSGGECQAAWLIVTDDQSASTSKKPGMTPTVIPGFLFFIPPSHRNC